MYVYGIRCAPCDLMGLPENAQADYYMDYGLLVFPTYTRASCVRSFGTQLDAGFWKQARLMLQHPMKPHRVTHLEHPWLAREETSVVAAHENFTQDWKRIGIMFHARLLPQKLRVMKMRVMKMMRSKHTRNTQTQSRDF